MQFNIRFKTVLKFLCIGVLVTSVSLYPYQSFAQLNNSLDNSLGSGGASNSSSSGSVGASSSGNSQTVDPLSSGTFDPPPTPGGPTDPPDDLGVPIDGGLGVLLTLGLIGGLRKRKK